MDFILRNRRGLLTAAAIGLYLRFLLEPTGWLFYELHHATGVDGIYWGYTVFRGGGYLLSTLSSQNIICLAVALVIFAFMAWRQSRRGEV